LKEKVKIVCDQAKLTEFLERQDKKYDTLVGEKGSRLSGGEKQRVSIARCLLKNPNIIVFDEATSSLDSITEKEIQESIEAISNRTTLVIAHRLSTIKNVDQIIVLEYGNILEKGTHDELQRKKGK